MASILTVENLSKKYIIGHQRQERYTALRDVLANGVSRGAPEPAIDGRSKPASAVTHIPHPFESLQLSVELLAVSQDA
jgi:hypothetical protein